MFRGGVYDVNRTGNDTQSSQRPSDTLGGDLPHFPHNSESTGTNRQRSPSYSCAEDSCNNQVEDLKRLCQKINTLFFI